MQLDFEGAGLDSEEVQVEERVYISAEEEAVLRVVVAFAAVGHEVGSFQDIQNLATGDEAEAAIAIADFLSESGLAAPLPDLEPDFRSGIYSGSGIFGFVPPSAVVSIIRGRLGRRLQAFQEIVVCAVLFEIVGDMKAEGRQAVAKSLFPFFPANLEQEELGRIAAHSPLVDDTVTHVPVDGDEIPGAGALET